MSETIGMNCDCLVSPRDVVDITTPLYQACGGKLYRLHVTGKADNIFMQNGDTLEQELKTIRKAINSNLEIASHLKSGAGLSADAAGDIYLDLAGMTDAERKKLADALIEANKGLMANSAGKVSLALKPAGGLKLEEGKAAVDTASLAGEGISGSGGKFALNVGGITSAQLKALAGRLKGNGLDVDASTGALTVDFSTMPASQMQAIVRSMAQQGGGLAVDGKGQLYVDFDTMSMDRFNKMLKSIRVPIWLSGAKNFYVDIAKGSDDVVDGIGESEAKAFKTIQAAVNYVCDNYNIGRYNAIINIAEGDYTGQTSELSIGECNRSTGSLQIRGIHDRASRVILPHVKVATNAYCELHDVTLAGHNVSANSWGALVYCDGGTLYRMRDVVFDMSAITEDSGTMYGLAALSGGSIYIYASQDRDEKTGINIRCGQYQPPAVLWALNKGTITLTADINVEDDITVKSAFAYAQTGGTIQVTSTSFANPGRTAQVNLNGHTVTGKRYHVADMSIISAGGPNFFPGTAEGTKTALGSYS